MKQRNFAQFVMLGLEAVISTASGAVMYILISRWIGTELLGQYSLALAWIMIFQTVGNFGVPEFVMRELGRDLENGGDYFNNGLAIGLVASTLSALAMVGLVTFFVFDPEVKKALIFGSVVLIPLTINLTCRGGFLAHKKSEYVSLIALAEMGSILSVNVYLILHEYGIIPIILTLVAGKSVFSLVWLYLFNKHIHPVRLEWDIEFCKRLWSTIKTFASIKIVGLIANRLNIIMLSWWTNLSVVGYYAAANKVMELFLTAPSIFSQLMLPQYARSFQNQKKLTLEPHGQGILSMFLLSMPLAVGLIFFADPIIGLLYGPNFTDSVIIFQVLMVFFIIEILDSILATVMLATGKQKTDLKLFSLNPAMNIFLNIILIPLWGGLGSAVAKTSGALISSGLRLIYITRKVVHFPWGRAMLKPLLGSGALILLFIPVNGQVHFAILALTYFSLIGLYLLFKTDLGRPLIRSFPWKRSQ